MTYGKPMNSLATRNMATGQQRRRSMLVDQKCADLAIHFLSDVPESKPEDVTELAEIIQARCEDFIADVFGGSS